MRWVKASERLPEKDHLVCMRGDGGGCFHYATADKDTLLIRMAEDRLAHHKYDPEWLDESTEPMEKELYEGLKFLIEQMAYREEYQDQEGIKKVEQLISKYE